MSGVSTNTPTALVELPQLDATVHGAREKQMPRLGKELHLLYALGVALVRVNALLGYVAFRRQLVAQQVDVEVLRRVQERAARVVERVVDVQRRLGRVLLFDAAAAPRVSVARPFRHQLVQFGALLVARLRHRLLVLVVGPRTPIALDVRWIVVAILLSLGVRVLRPLLVHRRE